jgi:hypothetical protein
VSVQQIGTRLAVEIGWREFHPNLCRRPELFELLAAENITEISLWLKEKQYE